MRILSEHVGLISYARYKEGVFYSLVHYWNGNVQLYPIEEFRVCPVYHDCQCLNFCVQDPIWDDVKEESNNGS